MNNFLEQQRDNLKAMILQEEKHYQCEDYLETDQPEIVKFSPLHIVAEMASLVTDVQHLSHESLLRRSPTSSLSVESKSCLSPSCSSIDLYKTSMSHRSQVELSLLSSWRNQMHTWICSVVDGLNLEQDIVAVTFSILDRYVAIKLKQDRCFFAPCRDKFQLYSMVCLYIAVKVVVPFQELYAESLVEISHGLFTLSDITTTELNVLMVLKWHVNPPTVMTFCDLYLKSFSSVTLSRRMFVNCQYMADVALADEFFISKPSSLIALGIICLSIQKDKLPFTEGKNLLESLQGLVHVHGDEFDSIFQRLECVC
jgi:hypothetical protein